MKNKVAPPFKLAEFDILFGTGISKASEIVEMGVNLGIIEKSGAWFYYDGNRLAQGKDNARVAIENDPALEAEIEAKIKSAELIRELSFLADYQRRSNRNPIDYLKTLYYAWFNIDPGETNITDEAVAGFGGVSAQRRERILQLRDEMREKYLVETASDNIPESAENADEAPVADESGVSEGDIALFKFLTEHDVPAVPATRILSIVRNSPNGRILFNELQKTFGNKNASEYMRVLREWKNAQ